MRKKIVNILCLMLCIVMVFGTTNVKAKEISRQANEEEIIASQTDAMPDAVVQAEAEEMSVYAPNIVIDDIQTMDMGRYTIVGVNQNKNENVSYRWQVYDFSTGSWTIFHDWDTATCVFWTPSHIGDYYLYVEAMVNGQVVASYAKLHHFAGCVTSLGEISFECGSDMCTYNVAYNTNDTELMFRWQVYDVSNGAWSTIRDWDAQSAGQWNPSHAGDYFLYVQAKGGDGVIHSKLLVCHVDAPRITSFIQSCTSGYVNECVVMGGTYSDSTLSVGRQRYLVFDGTYWKPLFQDGNNALWVPEQEGQYLLCYEIYDKKGNRIEQSFKELRIDRPYVNLNGLSTEHTRGLDYTFTLNADTNDVGIQYRWQYYNAANGSWYSITDWSNTLKVNWTPPSEGYYWISVDAKLRDGTIKSHTEGLVATRIYTEEEQMCNLANSYASATNYLLMVNCATHKVGVFTGYQGNWQLNYYWDCADGKASTPTVRGEFTVANKGYYFDSDGARCYYYTQFYGGYLFHSVLYSQKKEGVVIDGRVGMALSHGCVRLKIENAKWIYDNVPRGTKVVVYN